MEAITRALQGENGVAAELTGRIVPSFIFLLILLLAASLTAILVATVKLLRERGWLARASHSTLPAAADVPGADALLQAAGLAEGAARRSLVARRIVRLERLAQTRLASDAGALVEALEADERLTPGLAYWTQGVLVLVALLGTVMGMGVALGALPQFRSDSQDVSALNQVVQRMLPAFLITAGGIIATLIVSAMNAVLGVGVARFRDDLEAFTLEELAPRLLAAPRVDELNRVEELQRQLLQSLERLNNEADKIGAAAGAAGQTLAAAVHEMREGAEARAQQVQKKLLDGASDFVHGVVAAGTHLREAAEVVQATSDQTRQTIAQADQTVQAAVDGARAITALSGQTATTLKNTGDRLGGSLEALATRDERIPDALGLLTGSCERVGAAAEQLTHGQAAASAATQTVVERAGAVLERVDALKATLTQLVSDNEQRLAARDAARSAGDVQFAESIHLLRTQLQTEVSALGEALRGLSDKIAGGLGETLPQRLQAGVREGLATAGEAMQAAAAQTGQAAARTDALAQRLDRATADLAALLRDEAARRALAEPSAIVSGNGNGHRSGADTADATLQNALTELIAELRSFTRGGQADSPSDGGTGALAGAVRENTAAMEALRTDMQGLALLMSHSLTDRTAGAAGAGPSPDDLPKTGAAGLPEKERQPRRWSRWTGWIARLRRKRGAGATGVNEAKREPR